MPERMTVYEPGDRVATMSPQGEVRLYVVDDTGVLVQVGPTDEFDPEVTHLDNGEIEALCDPTLECRIVRVMADVTCDACRHEAARIFTTEQQDSTKGPTA